MIDAFQAFLILMILFWLWLVVSLSRSIYKDLMASNFLRPTEEKTFAGFNGKYTFRFYIREEQ